ncbi:Cytosolic iron-sulfur protein assembly protein [Coemansia spiralis]|uniref:Probable cytosolic iron-sulfur protein assembly protein 1 n=2 Tax=Coemansia TaxID=4863 RepID=A0A9W8G4H6_9FUNG|nr:Cytosolic iron-sulfur protein assembly protein [Coemansia umbellata]KAJ2672526.1 Cytosolic iron-sulfur protein assembly protein [Coemansia spiralis]
MPLQLKLVAELQGHEDRVWQVSWDPSGLRLASCSGDKSVRVWGPQTQSRFFTENGNAGHAWECVDTIDNAHKRTVRSVAFAPTGKALATASFDGTTAIWEKEDGIYECVATLEGHENETKSVAWSNSGQLLATCGRDRSVWIWESNGEGDFDCISVLMEHTNDVKMVAWHPKEEVLASFSYDDTIRVWKEEDDDWYSAATLTGHTSTVWAGAFSPDGVYLASASDDRTVRVWAQKKSTGGGMQEGFYYRPDTQFECVAVVPDTMHSRAIYSVSWAAASGASNEGDGLVHRGYLATGCGDSTLRVLNVTSQSSSAAEDGTSTGKVDVALECAVEHAHGLSDINSVQWNPAYAGWLATAGDDGVVRIWHLE